MIEEKWRSIIKNYVVSDMGQIKNTKTGIILKPRQTNCGYYRVDLYYDKKHHWVSIHRVVARAFPEICGEWFEGCQVNHKNECKWDNRACNLEVCTAKYNSNYGSHGEKISKACKNRLDCSKRVAQKLNGKIIAVFESQKEAERQTGLDHAHISRCCLGKQITHGGYEWSFVD